MPPVPCSTDKGGGGLSVNVGAAEILASQEKYVVSTIVKGVCKLIIHLKKNLFLIAWEDAEFV